MTYAYIPCIWWMAEPLSCLRLAVMVSLEVFIHGYISQMLILVALSSHAKLDAWFKVSYNWEAQS